VRRNLPALLLLLVVISGTPRGWAQEEAPAKTRQSRLEEAFLLLGEGEFSRARELLQKLAAGYPEDPWLQYDLAFSFYLEGNFFWAQRHLMQALELDARCGLCHRLMGLVLAQTGQWEEAAQEMGRFEELGGKDESGWPQLIGAVARYKQQDFHGASDLLDRVPDTASSSLRQVRDLYRSAIDRMRGAAFPAVDGYLSLGVVYDSNVSLEPSVSSPRFGGRGAAFGDSLAAGLALRPLRGWFVLEGWGRLYKSVYYSDRAGDFDVTQMAGGLRGRIPAWAELDFGYDFSTTLLGRGEDFWGPLWTGDARVEKPDFYVFQEVHGLHLAARFRPAESLKLTPRYAMSYKFHDMMRRDVMEHLLEVSLGIFFLDRKLKLFLVERAFVMLTITPTGVPQVWADPARRSRMDAYDAVGTATVASLSASLPGSLSLSASLGGGYTDYYNSYGDFAGITRRRRDGTLTAGLSLSWGATESLVLTGGYRYLGSFSTIPDYDYPRHIFNLLNLSWRFP